MAKIFLKCIDCDKKISSNVSRCSNCIDIKLFGSVEKVRESAKINFERIGIKVR